MKITFSKNLQQLMNYEHLTQGKLSREIDVSQSAISSWLSEKKEPSIASLWKLADYFQCTVDELIGRKFF